MKERNLIRFAILIFWTFFWGLSVTDKIIPAVQLNWVGKDFFALFIKFFESLGIKNPIFATIALASVATIEAVNFVLYLFSLVNFASGNIALAEKFFYRAILSSVALMTFFSVGDNDFGDRAQLLEHGLFWMLIVASWVVFKFIAYSEANVVRLASSNILRVALLLGVLLTAITAYSIVSFSNGTFRNASAPVDGKEVVAGVYNFDMPFLADRVVFRKTIDTFKAKHPDLNVTYTGPTELNSKMKTFLLLYVFTEKKGALN